MTWWCSRVPGESGGRSRKGGVSVWAFWIFLYGWVHELEGRIHICNRQHRSGTNRKQEQMRLSSRGLESYQGAENGSLSRYQHYRGGQRKRTKREVEDKKGNGIM